MLVPLALYLFSPMTMPAIMWWTAGLNQVFLQVSFFFVVGAWVMYLRGRRLGRLLALVAAVGVGCCST